MRASQLFFKTSKEKPSDATAISHVLLIRGGFISQLTSGIYNFLPLGFRVLKKIWRIIEEEMDRTGAQELLMPALHPKELWEITGRWDLMDDIMFKLQDRSGRWHVLGTTHEEIITWIVSQWVRSWRDLPVALYQIQVKFRDEPRPRGGLLRGREFIMKDLYSFHTSWEDLNEYYDKVHRAYLRCFKRMGLEVYAVEAHSGAIGGDVSHEFMLISESGEDKFLKCDSCGYIASMEIASVHPPKELPTYKGEPESLKKVHTPGFTSVEDLVKFLGKTSKDFIKTMLYKYRGSEDEDYHYVIVLVRGDKEVNEIKLSKFLGSSSLEMASPEDFQRLGLVLGYIGPVGLDLSDIKVIADYSIATVRDGVVGANERDYHLVGVNPENIKVDSWADISNASEGDPCPKCGSPMKVYPSIELGHIFKLGTKYSEAMKAYFTDRDGKSKPIIMGCYGIGVTRLISAVVEQYHDEDGIIWPITVAPYEVLILTVNARDENQRKVSEDLYKKLQGEGIEVLWDDRDETPGVKFKDADLIGIPVRVVIGSKLKEGKVEVSLRRDREKIFVPVEEGVSKVKELVKSLKKELEV